MHSANSTTSDDSSNNYKVLEIKINPKYQVQTRPYTPSEYKRLISSITELGQEQPLIVDEDGYILDGHHRLKVCQDLGIVPWTVTRKYENEEQKIKAIHQINWARRHCSQWELYVAAETKRPEIEAEVSAEQVLKYQKGKKGTQPIDVKNLTLIDIDNNSSKNNNKDGRVNTKLGEIVGVTSTTIWQWKQVLDNANKVQLKALEEGKTSPHKVYEKIKAARRQDKIIQQSIQINSKFSLPNGVTIHCGDFRNPAILTKIPNGSVSLIILDPPYAEEYWYLYKALPSIVMAKLKPNGHLISLFGDSMKRRFMNALEAEGMIYNTDISIQLEGPFSHDQHLRISRKKKDLLWYYKGPELITNGLLQNFIPSQRSEKNLHEWQQSTKEAEEIISRLTFPNTGDVVLDLMMGAGTNIKAALSCGGGRKAIGVEIDRVTCEKATAYVTSPSDINRAILIEV
jgi:16S rRNA G966 N2-methylase RsmD